MLAAFLFGLIGSLGHCVGMCVGIMLLLGGRERSAVSQMTLQLGRISSYALLGLLAGTLGAALGTSTMQGEHAHHHAGMTMPQSSSLNAALLPAQGVLALLVAIMAGYMALAMLGRVPSPELALAGLTKRWGRAARWLTASTDPAARRGPALSFVSGLLWGFLPCGMVLAALLTAAASLSPLGGLLTMLAFGLGTCPALLTSGWLARRPGLSWPRPLAATLLALFGAQMLFRGLASWGVVEHLLLGGLMLW